MIEQHNTVPHENPQKPVREEHAAYWKAFVYDLFTGTLKRVLVSLLLSGALFFLGAYLIWRFGIATQEVVSALKMVEATILFLVYIPMGVVYGIVYGLNSTILRKMEELERGIHLMVEPLMGTVIAKIPTGQQGISAAQFSALLDTQITAFSRASRSQFRLVSTARALSNFLVRTTLRLLRRTLVRDFLDSLHTRGETHVTAKTVETFTREKLVGVLVARYKDQFELLQYGLYGVGSLLVIGIPLVIILVRI